MKQLLYSGQSITLVQANMITYSASHESFCKTYNANAEWRVPKPPKHPLL